MNQGRIWCVVHPTVGLPLLLGSVALTSLAVHTAIMTHTNWMGNYWAGSTRTKTSMNDKAAPNAAVASNASAFTVTVAPAVGNAGAAPAAFVITVTPNAGPAATQAVTHEPRSAAAARQTRFGRPEVIARSAIGHRARPWRRAAHLAPAPPQTSPGNPLATQWDGPISRADESARFVRSLTSELGT